MRWELVVAVHDFLVYSHRVVIIEGWVAGEHFENEYAQRPPVHILVVPLRLDDLWCKVLRRATQSVSLVFDNLGEAEIGDLHMAFPIDQQIFGLQVSVGNVHSMEVVESQEDLTGEEKCHIVGEAALTPQKREQLATTSVVQQHVNVRRCLKVAFQVYDEWMVDDGEDFLLTLDMIDLF
eukprot:CAMPEP_0185582974 /NCGR_PEP_ID=MMETSP0434-20130131/21243_1 /TAXON_ID=626734 ORGANISM="Favella taraikaensis, Strain Fe Narragansett Bay" /NCGR_SAMPLE_ID=MMETSP0434 /ASSEMBLY_ACC=CAM_ASM_000379 /LENGTH=178 /DNA_ID=CAMNT_0028201947 /DNA_START=433 /DNA_END=969 /DNA_ORIENTATION=+